MRQRNLGVALTAGGGAVFIVGLALWGGASSTQSQVDAHPINNASDIADLKALERTTLAYAVVGDILVVAGLALGGYGGWVLYKDHKARSLLVTPTPMEHGGGIAISGAW